MKHFYTPEGERALIEVMRLEPLLAFDFDGTLAPIVEQPEEAKISEAAATLLARLTKHRPVAIITGRSIADVVPRLGFEPSHVIGSHGAEDPHAVATELQVAALTSLRSRLSERAAEFLAAGVMVEDKEHSVALHYRLAPDHDSAMGRIAEFLQGLDPSLRTFGGKFVVNVVASGAPDKGDAVRSLMARSGSGSAVFCGDDINDEAVFESAQPHWLTVRIGKEYADSKAMYYVDTHADVTSLLRKMLALLEGG
jgi:trehalose 6-phosphate phosphatase